MQAYQNLSLDNLPNEVWLPLPGFESNYMISSEGRVRSINRKSIRRQHLNKDGYPVITLYKNHKYSYPLVHRLVATTFIANSVIGKNEVDHIDGNRTNNSVSNLRWTTRTENIHNPNTISNFKNRKGIFTGRFGKSHPKSKPIYAISESGDVFEFEGSRDAHRKGYQYWGVQSCLHGKQETYKGLRWYFREDPPRL